MKIFSGVFLSLLLLLVSHTACAPAASPPAETLPPLSPAPSSIEWLYEDLLILDPLDSPASDVPDIFAVYLHPSGQGWVHFRIDLLNSLTAQNTLALAFHTQAGGTSRLPQGQSPNISPWDLLIEISAPDDEPLQATVYESPNTIVPAPISVEEKPESRSVIVSLPVRYLSEDISLTTLQVLITDPETVLDLTTPIPLSPTAWPQAPLLLTFWDTLPANMPAQLLRRWDGAHTGPFGERHGLSRLLAAAERNQIPMSLLDLKEPGALVGLSMLNQLERVLQLEQQGLLYLPETAVTDPFLSIQAAEESRKISQAFGFNPSQAAYGTFLPPYPETYTLFFTSLKDPIHILTHQGQRFIPLPYSPWQNSAAQQVQQVDRDGLTRETWAQLLQTALSPDDADLLVMGGSLITSPWADNAIAPAAFQDLANHPWIQVLSAQDLQTFPAIDSPPTLSADGLDLLASQALPEATSLKSNPVWGNLKVQLENLPDNPTADSARAMAFHLLRPAGDLPRYQLQSNYWGQLGHLLYAARWADNPTPQSSCTVDLDFNGDFECVLATPDFLATFEPSDASLVTLFHRDSSGIRQWIGPTSQIVVGLSSPPAWELGADTHSDPAVIPGSLRVDLPPTLAFEVSEVGSTYIRFISADNSVTREYALDGENLTVTFQADRPFTTELVLCVDPQQRFQPKGIDPYQLRTPADDSLCWGDAVCVKWTDQAQPLIHTFKDSLESLASPENPNQVYPPGHFLPVPLAVLEISANTYMRLSVFSYESGTP